MSLLTRFRWYRRWKGGRWEQWYVDFPVCGVARFHNPPQGRRPMSLCRGTPDVEDYR